ncbi:hypothetical protein EVAR_40143_1 [Eumeta japonica]|uniref:Uncharacterized protein n=1 Tax=Eumeta variegata TaxID=151549 RepID=A0A4C1WBR6_EUMVA|nr:hypothetical protein EVAR_40143_1 [Eumeta japonica]
MIKEIFVTLTCRACPQSEMQSRAITSRILYDSSGWSPSPRNGEQTRIVLITLGCYGISDVWITVPTPRDNGPSDKQVSEDNSSWRRCDVKAAKVIRQARIAAGFIVKTSLQDISLAPYT